MPLTRIFGFGLAMVMVITVFSSVGSAQIKRPLRWLGHGFSDGYHQCNPGPNSDYYNPYSLHNSFLVSQDPGAYKVLLDDIPAPSAGPIKIGVPFSVYAAPTPKDNSFVPSHPVDQPTPIDAQPSPSDKPDGANDGNDNSVVVPLLNRIRTSQTRQRTQRNWLNRRR